MQPGLASAIQSNCAMSGWLALDSTKATGRRSRGRRSRPMAFVGTPNSILLEKPFAPRQLVTPVSQLLITGTPKALNQVISRTQGNGPSRGQAGAGRAST